MTPSYARRWHGLEIVVANRWLGLALGGLTVAALAFAALEVELGGGVGPNMAFAVGLLALLTWSAVGLRAAVGEPGLVRWRRLLELAEVRGAVAGVDVAGNSHAAPALAEIAPDAHLLLVDPRTHVALPVADGSCNAVVFGPRVATLDEASRETLLDEARRALRTGGHLVLVLPSEERRAWIRVPPVEWMPGSPQGWWSDALAERFEQVRHAPLATRLDAILATRTEPQEQAG
jgi:SAM-dependent methyltransferase